jgi:arginyl-tRNA synthetase
VKEGSPLDTRTDPGEAARALEHEAEVTLAKTIARLPRIVHSCAEERKVHTLASYAERLASVFNIFYRDVPVLQAGDPRAARLLLVEASRVSLANSLNTLGIAAPEQM